MCSMPIFIIIIIIIIISSCHTTFLLGNSYLDPTVIHSTNGRGEGSRPVQITGDRRSWMEPDFVAYIFVSR
jgi:hypothetical protein